MQDLKPYIERYNNQYCEKYERPFNEKLVPVGREAKKRGYFKRCEFEEIYKWKAPRALNTLEKSEAKIIDETRKALAESDISKKLEFLLNINGVRVAVASAILTVLDPVNFGIIDRYAWKALEREKLLKTKTFDSGKNKKRGIQNYRKYLKILRKLQKEQHIQAIHDVDKGLMMRGKELK